MTDHPSIQQMLDSLKYLQEETALLDKKDEKHLRVVSSWIDLLLDDTDYREMQNQPEFRDKPDDYGVLVEFLPDLPGIGAGRNTLSRSAIKEPTISLSPLVTTVSTTPAKSRRKTSTS